MIIGGASAGGVVVAAVVLAVVHALVATSGPREQGSHGGRHRSLRDATGTLNTVFTDSDVAGIRIVTISPLDVTNGGARRDRQTHNDIVNTTVL